MQEIYFFALELHHFGGCTPNLSFLFNHLSPVILCSSPLPPHLSPSPTISLSIRRLAANKIKDEGAQALATGLGGNASLAKIMYMRERERAKTTFEGLKILLVRREIKKNERCLFSSFLLLTSPSLSLFALLCGLVFSFPFSALSLLLFSLLFPFSFFHLVFPHYFPRLEGNDIGDEGLKALAAVVGRGETVERMGYNEREKRERRERRERRGREKRERRERREREKREREEREERERE